MTKTLILACALACASMGAYAATAGQVTHLSGTLSVKRADGSSKLLSIKSEVLEGDTISTEADTYARVKFSDGAEVVLRPNTQVKVQSYAYQEGKPEADNALLSMLKGGLRAVTGLIGKRNRDKVSLSTATATIGIRGTHFGALLCQNDCGGIQTGSGRSPANGLHVDVADGAISMRNGAGEQIFNVGQFGYAANFNSQPVVVPAGEGVLVTVPDRVGGGGGSRAIGGGGQTQCDL